MARILHFPPRPARGATADGSVNTRHLHPVKRHLEPAEIYRALGEPCPDLYAAFRHEPSAWEELVEDWRDFVREVRRSPYSHALVAVFTIVGWTVALLLPIWLGAFS